METAVAAPWGVTGALQWPGTATKLRSSEAWYRNIILDIWKYIEAYGGRRFVGGVRNTHKWAFILKVFHFYHGPMAGAWRAHGVHQR